MEILKRVQNRFKGIEELVYNSINIDLFDHDEKRLSVIPQNSSLYLYLFFS